MGLQVSLYHHHMTHKQKLWHLNEILSHVTIYQIRYSTYHLTRNKTHFYQILLHQSHTTHWMMSIIKKEDLWKMTKRNAVVKRVLMTKSNRAWILHPSYLQLRTKQRPLSSNWISIHYSYSFISYPSWFHLQKFLSNFSETYMLIMDYPSKRG